MIVTLAHRVASPYIGLRWNHGWNQSAAQTSARSLGAIRVVAGAVLFEFGDDAQRFLERLLARVPEPLLVLQHVGESRLAPDPRRFYVSGGVSRIALGDLRRQGDIPQRAAGHSGQRRSGWPSLPPRALATDNRGQDASMRRPRLGSGP